MSAHAVLFQSFLQIVAGYGNPACHFFKGSDRSIRNLFAYRTSGAFFHRRKISRLLLPLRLSQIPGSIVKCSVSVLFFFGHCCGTDTNGRAALVTFFGAICQSGTAL